MGTLKNFRVFGASLGWLRAQGPRVELWNPARWWAPVVPESVGGGTVPETAFSNEPPGSGEFYGPWSQGSQPMPSTGCSATTGPYTGPQYVNGVPAPTGLSGPAGWVGVAPTGATGWAAGVPPAGPSAATGPTMPTGWTMVSGAWAFDGDWAANGGAGPGAEPLYPPYDYTGPTGTSGATSSTGSTGSPYPTYASGPTLNVWWGWGAPGADPISGPTGGFGAGGDAVY